MRLLLQPKKIELKRRCLAPYKRCLITLILNVPVILRML